jgi:hypothetical protein
VLNLISAISGEKDHFLPKRSNYDFSQRSRLELSELWIAAESVSHTRHKSGASRESGSSGVSKTKCCGGDFCEKAPVSFFLSFGIAGLQLTRMVDKDEQSVNEAALPIGLLSF